MKKQRYFTIAIIIIIIATCILLAAHACFHEAHTKSIVARLVETNRSLLEQQSEQYRSIGSICAILSLTLAGLFVVFSIISIKKKEQVYISALIVLGIIYFLLTFTLA